MFLLPSEKFNLKTHLSLEEAKQRLSDVIESPRNIRLTESPSASPPAQRYQGKITENKFKIHEIIYTRNSFLPIIEGKIFPQNIGSLIIIKMRMHHVVNFFMFLWLSSTGILSVLSIIGIIFKDIGFAIFAFIFLTLFIFTYFLNKLVFKTQTKKPKEFLSTLFSSDDHPK